MKKWIIIIAVAIMGITITPSQSQAQIPIIEIIKAGIKKVIRAVDLQIQRQQNKVIWLQNAQKVLENAMSKLKLKEISEWTDKQKELYKTHFDDLKKVKSIISYYTKVRVIVEQQKSIVNNYKHTWNLVRNDGHFTVDELAYMACVYTGILDHSFNNMEELYLVINSFRTQMTDAKRLEAINKVADKVQQNYTDIRAFNADNAILSMQRAQSQKEIELVKKLYGIQ